MSDNTKIEWTATYHPDGTVTPGATWNPIRGDGPNRWMCAKISPGCDNCYASTFNRRMGGQVYPAAGDPAGADLLRGVTLAPDHIMVKPHQWARPRRVFVCSMTDLFGEWVPFDLIDQVFAVMDVVDRHTYMVLTKRPRRMLDYIEYRRERAATSGMPLSWPIWSPNIWAGVTIESDRYAWRADLLRAVPAAVRWISAEPLLSHLDSVSLRSIQWIVVGGESNGPAERRLVTKCFEMEHQIGGRGQAHCQICNGTGWMLKSECSVWIAKIQEEARRTGAAFFLKQLGGPTPKAGGRLFRGRTWDEFPTPARQLAAV